MEWPRAWHLSRICEEFNCSPIQAERELRQHPDLVTDILALRSYAQCWDAMKHAGKQTDIPPGSITQEWAKVHKFKKQRKD